MATKPITSAELQAAFGRGQPVMPQPAPQPGLLGAKPQGGGVLGFLSDPDARARLAIALQGMTMNPNQAFIQSMQQGISDRKTDREKTAADKAAAEAQNKTIAWLRTQGTRGAELAAAVESGAIGAPDAAKIAMTPAQQADVPSSFAALDLQAQAAGLQKGTPEYQNFMLNGGGGGQSTPAAFAALDLQAQAAGFTPGTPEYQNFMATRGAGLVAEAKSRAENQVVNETAAPKDIAAADKALSEIEALKKDPNRALATGATSVLNAIPGSPGYDFQNRVNQVKSGAFMTAIQQMRGMGALSNAEGQTATAAVTRLDTATSEEEFLSALNDYEAIIKLARDRAQKAMPSAAPTAPAGATVLTYNPATGELE